MRLSPILVLGAAAVLSGCAGGEGTSCSVADNGDGTSTVSCGDGTKSILRGGQAGQSGASGPNGAPGPSGKTALSSHAPEPAGANCPTGGTAIKTGLDADGNGALADAEVTSTSYLCNATTAGGSGVIQGTYAINNSLDVAFLSGVTTITGDLIVSSPGLVTISLPGLTEIGGRFTLNSATVTTIDMPALTKTGELYIANNAALATFSLPALTTSPSVIFMNSPALTSVSLPALTSAAEQLAFLNTPQLTTLSLGVLGGVKKIRVEVTGLTTLAAFAGVTGADLIRVSANPALANLLGLSALAGPVGEIIVSQNALLTSLAGLGGITASLSLEIQSNAALASLDLAALVTVTDVFYVYSNALLKECLVTSLLAQLDAPPSNPYSENNNGAGTCP